MFEGLLALLCVLLSIAALVAIVTVVGHGLWVMFAAIFSSPSRIPPRSHFHDDASEISPGHSRAKVSCAECGVDFPRREGRCPFCGLEINAAREKELDDLDATARTIQRLKEQGKLAEEPSEQTYRAIEARQDELVQRTARHRPEEQEIGPIAQLEGWFGNDFGAALSVGEKKKALAHLRTLEVDTLGELTAKALVGAARLLTSVGMMSRACGVYRVLLQSHPDAPVAQRAANDALELACRLRDRRLAEELARLVQSIPGLLDRDAQLAALVDRVQSESMWQPVPKNEEQDAPPVTIPEPAAPIPFAIPVAAKVVPPPPAQLPRESVEVTPTTAPAVHVAPPPMEEPALPRRSFAEWIAVFMEEKNILWGELIGGTLIVGCSIALVISLWSKLAEIEFFPFLILAAITSAVLSAGFYTLHHWKLESTSRGLLLIGMLLAPLDFAVLAGLPHEADAWWLHYALGIAAFALFGWMVLRAARILIAAPLDAAAPSDWLTTAALGASSAALMIYPMLRTNAALSEYVLSLSSVAAMVVALGWILLRLHEVESWSLPRLGGLMVALGCMTFACGVTLGFPIFNSDDVEATLLRLSPAVTLLGVPMLFAGVLLPRKLAREDGDAYGLWRTAGTGLALAGVFVMFGGFVLSMREPSHRWTSGLINAGTMLAAAWMLRAPLLHIMAQLYLGILVIVAGTLDIDALIASPSAGLRMTGMMLLQVLAAEGWMRWQRRRDALCYAVGSGVAAALAVILILPRAQVEPALVALVLGTTAFTWLFANLRWRSSKITYACAATFAAAIFFGFRWFDADAVLAAQLLWSVLTFTSVTLAAAVVLRLSDADWLRDTYRVPMQFACLAATAVVVAIVAIEQVHGTLSLENSAVACAWLAAAWLVLAVFESSAPLFALFQTALCFAWFFAAAARLRGLGWHLQEPYALQVYGAGLAALCLASEIARAFLRSSTRVMTLLNPVFVPVDRAVACVLVVAQYVLALLVVLPSVGHEILPTPEIWRVFPAAWYESAFSIWPGLLIGLLAGVLASWWRSQTTASLVGLTVVALTLPLLVAGGWFADDIAAASALRWGLALVFALASVLLWLRHLFGERASAAPAPALRGLLLAGAVAPVILITLIVVGRKLGGGEFAGPIDGFFTLMRGSVSLLIPLAAISVTLAGHGFRERLAYYLSGAGWLANVSCVGGFLLTVPREAMVESSMFVNVALVASAAAWAWVILWAWSARSLEQGEAKPLLDSPLLSLHGVLGALLYCTVMAVSVVAIAAREDAGRRWVEASGSVGSWVVFAIFVGGACSLFWTRRASIPLHLIGALSSVHFVVASCSVELWQPGHSFNALMFLAGVLACGWMCGNLFLDIHSTPRWLTRTASRWEEVIYTSACAIAATLLGANSFLNGQDRIWSANAILLAGVGFGLLAYRRKSEMWFTFATVLAVLASLLITIHLDTNNPHLGLRLVQVSLAIVGFTSLLRLAGHPFITPENVEERHLLLLPVQIALGVAANVLLLGVGLTELAFAPENPNEWLPRVGDLGGWLAAGFNVAAAIWYLALARPRLVVHIVALGGLVFGVILAGTMSALFPNVLWLGHHVLTLTWTLVGLSLLIVSWASHVQPALGPHFWPSERRTWLAESLRRWLPERWTRLWVTACGTFVVLLALRAISVEPDRPFWSVGNTVAVILLITALAVWARAPGYLYGAGLLFNVIGLLLFTAWSSHRVRAPGPILAQDEWISIGVLAQILSFAAASIACSLLERNLLRRGIDFTQTIAFPYAQAALIAGIHLLAIGVGLANGLLISGENVRIASGLAWVALGMLVLASGVELWRPAFHRFTRYHLYTCGLTGIGLLLHNVSPSVDRWFILAMLLLSAYVLVIVLLARVTVAWSWLAEALRLPAKPDVHGRWFWNVQILSTMIVIGLSWWVVLSHDSLGERLCGPAACLLATASICLLAPVWRHVYAIDDAEGSGAGLAHRQFPIYLGQTFAIVTMLCAGWAILRPDLPAIWLQRIAASLVVAIGATAIYHWVVPRWIGETDWTAPSRRFSAIGGILSVVLLLLLLGHELIAFNPAEDVRTTPLILELKILVTISIVVLTGLTFWSALAKGPDIYGIEGDQRSFYVYGTELLLVALFAHVRLSVPVVPKMLGQYWFLVVMVLAFVASLCGEWLASRRQLVLSRPLQRSALVLAFVPVIAFQLARVREVFEPLQQVAPGVAPFLGYLERLGQQHLFDISLLPMESLCWLLLAIFFAWQAQRRQSANLGIFAALALNFGVWVLLGHQDATTFIQRPQLWLIPLGLIILVAEFVNRGRLGFWPSLTVRYVGLSCIYLSSMLEMFMAGLGTSVIFPIALALLAIAGIMLGILFRVRAFLLAGFIALFVDVFAQIWYAAVGQGRTWIWWVCGIILGVMILALFAIFEKRRNEMLRVLDDMKRWN